MRSHFVFNYIPPMKKRIVASLIGLSILAAFAIPANSQSSTYRPFYDVDSSNPYYNAIEFIRRNRIALGFNDGSFRPNTIISRAQFVAMAVKARTNTPSSSQYRSCFSDVQNEWFANEICYAKFQGWLPSTGQYFSPNLNILATDARFILERAFGKSVSVSETASGYVTRGAAAQMLYTAVGGTPVAYDPYYYDNRVRAPDSYYPEYGEYNNENRYRYDDRYYDDRYYDASKRYDYGTDYDVYTSANAAPLPSYRPRYAKVPPSGRVYVSPEPNRYSNGSGYAADWYEPPYSVRAEYPYSYGDTYRYEQDYYYTRPAYMTYSYDYGYDNARRDMPPGY